MNYLRSGAVLISVLLVLGGCGGGSGSDGMTSEKSARVASTSEPSSSKIREVGLTLDGYHGAENVGFLMALNHGYFRDAGLKVDLYTPILPGRPIPYVVQREVEVSVAQLPQVVIAKAKGAHVVAIGSVIAQPTASMIWLARSQIKGLADLKGKTIGTLGLPYQEAFLEHVLGQVGLMTSDVTIKHVKFRLVAALKDGRVDAIFGGSPNLEGAKLKAQGSKPVITPIQRLGIPAYDELVMVARTDNVAKDPELYRRLIAAVAKGTSAAIENPDQALAAVEKTIEGDPELDRRMARAELKATLPLFSRSGYLDPERADQLINWMEEERIIKDSVSPKELLTNSYR